MTIFYATENARISLESDNYILFLKLTRNGHGGDSLHKLMVCAFDSQQMMMAII